MVISDLYLEIEIVSICKMVLEALAYIHSKSIIHRDLNPSNLIVSMDLNSIMILDFGLARFSQISEGIELPSVTPVGDQNYRSPDMLSNNYSFGTDIWALGKIILEAVLGKFLSRKKFHYIVIKSDEYDKNFQT